MAFTLFSTKGGDDHDRLRDSRNCSFDCHFGVLRSQRKSQVKKQCRHPASTGRRPSSYRGEKLTTSVIPSCRHYTTLHVPMSSFAGLPFSTEISLAFARRSAIMKGNIEGESPRNRPKRARTRLQAARRVRIGSGLPSSRRNPQAYPVKLRRALPLQGARAPSKVVPRRNASPLRTGRGVFFWLPTRA